jgi:hypothetical protein
MERADPGVLPQEDSTRHEIAGHHTSPAEHYQRICSLGWNSKLTGCASEPIPRLNR